MRFRFILLAACLVAFRAPTAAIDWTGLQPIGAVAKSTRSTSGLELSCDDGSIVQLRVLAADLVRIRVRFGGQGQSSDHSWAIARTEWPATAWQLQESASNLTVTTAELEVVVNRNPLLIEFRDAATHRTINADERPMARDPKTGRIAVAKKLGLDEHFYGLGEKAARLDRRRSQFVMWNSDTPGYVEGTDPIYQSIPFYVGIDAGPGAERQPAYGLFYDNSFRSTFDLGYTGQEYAGYTAEGGGLDYYFFHGPSLKKIVARYTELTGRIPLPPLWALGNQQSRYSYYPDTLVEQVAAAYRAHDLPLDVLYLDIHYMNGYRVFTWDPARFPDPARLTADLHKLGVQVVTIIDPGVKYQPSPTTAPAKQRSDNDPGLGPQDSSYYVFNEGVARDAFLHRADGSLYIGEVWPGKAVFVDYTREDARRWWGDLHRALLDRGVAGVWTDMNEPSDFVDKSGASQKDVVFDDLGAHTRYDQNRNLFALNMARATFEGLARLQPTRRPFVITRAGYAGIQRYSTMWTGDNNASFESLALNIPMFTSLGLSGESFVGSDLPGFIGRGDGELLARSYEVAFLVPLCRNHGAVDQYDHEPWRYGAPYEAIVRKYLKLRYRLLPFLYTTLEEAHRTGMPLFRPLLLNFQDDPNTLNLDDEFMIGDALLAAPVVHAGERAREIYLPRGLWYDFWTGHVVDAPRPSGESIDAAAVRTDGSQFFRVDVPLDHVPLYVRGGTVVPSTEPMNYVTEKTWSPIRFDVYPDEHGNASGSLYEDDGLTPDYEKGVCRRTTLSLSRTTDGDQLTIAAPEGNYRPASRNFEIIVHGGNVAPHALVLDHHPLEIVSATTGDTGWWRDDAGGIHVRIQDDSSLHTLLLRP